MKRNRVFLLSLGLLAALFISAYLFAQRLQQNAQVRNADPAPVVRQPATPALPPEEIAKRNEAMQTRLGLDDGFVATLFFGSTLHGSLETCG